MGADPSRSIRVLVVGGSAEDGMSMRAVLGSLDRPIEHARIESQRELAAALDGADWDVVLVEADLHRLDPVQLLRHVRKDAPHIPCIIVGRSIEPERAMELLSAGARDYVDKAHLSRLPRIVARVLRLGAPSPTPPRAAQEAAEAYATRAFETRAVAMFELDLRPFQENETDEASPDERELGALAKKVRISRANQKARELLGSENLDPSLLIPVWHGMLRALATGSTEYQQETEIAGPDGARISLNCSATLPVKPEELARVLVSCLDVSETHRLERQLRGAQRMEAIGRLAGGIMHDFNNILSVINSYTELLAEELPEGSQPWKDAQIIRDSALKAGTLVSRLLTFSRKQSQQLSHVDLNGCVTELHRVLARVIGEDIRLEIHLDSSIGPVLADVTQLEQVLMNLAVNARDAMPDGGTMTIETQPIVLDEDHESPNGLLIPAGTYVMLALSDTGQGMDADTLARVFDPFFTTKGSGKGTGLGLAMVRGIIGHWGGHVWVYSEPGTGTTFKIYLPVTERAKHASEREMKAAVVGGSERILVVEDQKLVRQAVRLLLERQGYTVLEARHGAHALDLCRSTREPIDGALIDLIMPGINGAEIGRQLSRLYPGMKIVLMSGYSDRAAEAMGHLEQCDAFVQKPISRDAMLRTLRRVLDEDDSRKGSKQSRPA